MTTDLFARNALLVLVLMSLLWIWSVFRRDASVVDPWWSMAFLFIAVQTTFFTCLTPGKTLLLVLAGVWAVRLWMHLTLRSRGKPEDPRYADFRIRFGKDRYWWISFFQVFLLQGALALFISLPLQVSAARGAPDPVTWLDGVGAVVFLVGFLFEAIGDWQLERFRKQRSARDEVLRTGLWRYTRHPNYFGEAVLWWGFWFASLDAPLGWLTFPAPVLMTFLLLRVSGVSMLDAHLTRTKPKYAEYIRTTSAFLPRIPRV